MSKNVGQNYTTKNYNILPVFYFNLLIRQLLFYILLNKILVLFFVSKKIITWIGPSNNFRITLMRKV